jgi:hypothetical protein
VGGVYLLTYMFVMRLFCSTKTAIRLTTGIFCHWNNSYGWELKENANRRADGNRVIFVHSASDLS